MSVIAVEDLRVASIPMTEFRQLLQRHPQLAVALLMDVVARLRRLLAATKSLTMEDVYGRVVKLLVARAVEADGKRVTERLTHAEIGHQRGRHARDGRPGAARSCARRLHQGGTAGE